MKRGRLRSVGWWAVWVVAVIMIGVGFASFISYGEATLMRSVRLNWWDGNFSVMWGARSGASGALVSVDEFYLSPGFKSYGFGFGSSRVQIPVHYLFVVGVALLLVFVFVYFRRWLMRLGLGSVECCSCGYSLEGLGGGVCPECGEKRGG